MKYDAILYDMDGTVLDTLSDLTDSVNYSLAQFNLPTVSKEQTAMNLGNGAKRLIALSCPEGTDEELMQKVLDFYMPWYNAHCLIKTAPYEGIVPLMQEMQEKNVKQALVSNKPDSAVKPLAKRFFDGLLEFAIGESPEIRRKPAPDSVLSAAKEMNVRLDRCVYIGDTEVDIQTAKNAGMDCIAVAWGFRSTQQLEAAGASMIAHNVDELREYLNQ